MKRMHLTAVLAGALGIAASFSAVATPVHATFSGSVNGSSGLNAAVLTDFPIGTAASFDVTFDDANLGPNYPSAFGVGPVSGTVSLGALNWTLDDGHISALSFFSTAPNPVVWYQLQLTGTGPTISSSASLFGLFLQITPDLEPFSPASLMVGFGYPVQGGTFYSYADIAGQYSVTKTSVPEPATAFLMIPALAMLWRARRPKVN